MRWTWWFLGYECWECGHLSKYGSGDGVCRECGSRFIQDIVMREVLVKKHWFRPDEYKLEKKH